MKKLFAAIALMSSMSVNANEFCYATYTVEGDLYIPGIAGYSVYLERIDELRWVIKRATESGLHCSGQTSFNYVWIPDIRGINYQGSALFIIQDGYVKWIPEMGPRREDESD